VSTFYREFLDESMSRTFENGGEGDVEPSIFKSAIVTCLVALSEEVW